MKRRLLLGRVAIVGCLLGAAGCDMKGCRSDNSSGLPASSELPATTFGDARLTGTVTFQGTPPEPRVVGESESCGTVVGETLVVSDAGGLANVLVYLDDDAIETSDGSTRSPAQLDQTGCRFVPRVQGVQVRQPFLVTNGDPMRHNVRFAPERNDRQNLIFPTGGTQETVTFQRPEDEPFVVKCDIHPWMTAYVRVFGHPFFATTDAAGSFEIDRVPAGTYDVVAWHELLGERTARVEITGEASVDLVFAAPQG